MIHYAIPGWNPPGLTAQDKPPRDSFGWVIGAFLYFWLIVWALCAQAGEAPAGSRATVRIKQQTCSPQGCGTNWSSGTTLGGLRDSRFGVLTCAHGIDPRKLAAVELVPGEWYEGQVVGHDHAVDLALLAVAYRGRLPVIPLAASPPDSASVSVRGFPSGESYRERPANLLRLLNPVTELVDSTFIPGESGGTVCVGAPGNERLVGVICATDNPSVPPPRRHGYIVPWQAVNAFVLTSNGEQPRVSPPPEEGPPAEKPFRRSTPAPPTDLGPMATEDPPPAKPKPEPEPEVDWSLVRLVILVPRQAAADPYDVWARLFARVTSDIGPGKTVRRMVNETTAGKADITFVFERLEPEKYAEVVATSGVTPGKYASLVALVKKQDAGLLSPLKTLVARIGQRVAERKLDAVPVGVVLERTAKADFDELVAALAREPPAAPIGWGEGLLGTLYAAAKGLRHWIQAKRGVA